MHMSDATPMPALTQAPGARAAKVCGVLGILFALTCAGLPIAIILGIVALVKQGKAKRLAQAAPDQYESVSATGLVTGIISLVLALLMIPVGGILSAIAIPAYMAQRDRAREVAVQSNLNLVKTRAEALLADLQARQPGLAPFHEALLKALAQDPEVLALKNPVSSGLPGFMAGAATRNATVPLGTVVGWAAEEVDEGVTTSFVQFKATVRQGREDKALEAELVTHTSERVKRETEDGWQVVEGEGPRPNVEPPAEAPASEDPKR
jgi:Tfp pilus assembly major pilin PilA